MASHKLVFDDTTIYIKEGSNGGEIGWCVNMPDRWNPKIKTLQEAFDEKGVFLLEAKT